MKSQTTTGVYKFKAVLEIIGINPFVFVPDAILNKIIIRAGKDKGPIPIQGMLNDVPYNQTLVKYKGAWRLYVNTTMLKKSPQRIGEKVSITIAFDASNRSIEPHPQLIEALNKNQAAKKIYDALTPSLRKEIVRYITSLKTEKSVNENIIKAIDFLLGKGRFVGRDKPKI